jgi:hypothetical protein
MTRTIAGVLTALTALFLARVAGQALVAFAGISWLPPMEAWYSGLLPYPLLLPTQILILGVQLVIDRQVWRAAGFFAAPHSRLGRALRRFSYVYALAMLVRWILTRAHGIPIAFHWVLAAYVFTLGHLLARERAERSVSAEAMPTVTPPRGEVRRAVRPTPLRSARTR